MSIDFDEKIKLYRIVKNSLSDFEREDWEKKFAIEYTHNSTAIEGNALTLLQTKLVLEDKISPAEVPLRDVMEVQSHGEAFDYIKDQLQQKRELDEDFIKDVHERVVPARGVGGMYRSILVYISGAEHVPPNHVKVREEMKFFVNDLREKENSGSDPIDKAAWTHSEVVRIHPFQDGNGRTCRLLMNYSLIQDGYPPVDIKKQQREKYFETLEKYALERDIKPFCEFVKKTMDNQLNQFLEIYKDHININSLDLQDKKLINSDQNIKDKSLDR